MYTLLVFTLTPELTTLCSQTLKTCFKNYEGRIYYLFVVRLCNLHF